ncbi:uncharacterized protein LOC114310742 [Camellia sinensis]|uniref:uncharacterized protein LOC114310742 n=1 Tax=Camellia sinensis TaxID=4442 RepID=UPI001036C046|nr:uncharacterized protein LOC114310742 [Camellia sinensis]
MSIEGSIPRKAKEQSSAITFFETDWMYPFSHNHPLYVTVYINEVEFKKAFLDSGAFINIMTRATLEKARISEESIVKQPIVITGFGGERRVTMGCVTIDLAIKEIRLGTKFYIIDPKTNYHIILRRTWMHRYGVVPSSYNQCVKAKWGKKMVTKHFETDEAHYSDAIYFIVLSVKENLTTSKPQGVKIPCWEDIKDDKKLKKESADSESKDEPPDDDIVIKPEVAPECMQNELQPQREQLVEVDLSDGQDAPKEMLGLDPDLVSHYLDVFPNPKPIKQVAQKYHSDLKEKIKEEIEKFQHIGHQMFSFMDGFSRYNHIKMAEDDAEKAAFRTPLGNFFYTVMLFGLKNAKRL